MILHLLIVRHSRYQLTFYLSMILFSHNYHNHSKKRRRRRFPNILASLDICIKLFKSNKNDISGQCLMDHYPWSLKNQKKKNMLKAIRLSTQPKQESICFNRDNWGSFCWPHSKADLIGISMSVNKKITICLTLSWDESSRGWKVDTFFRRRKKKKQLNKPDELHLKLNAV